MKTRTLFLTLLTSILILLISNSFAFAGTISACIKSFQGVLYNVRIDAGPVRCLPGDTQISWNQEGPPGQDGQDGQDGADGEQGPPGPPGGPQFILKDKDGIEVGDVITVNVGAPNFIPVGGFTFAEERSVLTSFEVQKADTSTVTVAVPAIRSGFQFQNRVIFQNTGCTGTPRIRTDIFFNAGFPPAFALSAVAGTPGQPQVRKLYVQANEAEVPANLVHQSLLIGDFCVTPANIPGPSVTMEQISVPLNVTHPGPFTLEKP